MVGLPTIAATATVSALLIIATISIAMKIQKRQVRNDMGAQPGDTGHALSDFGKEGQVKIGAEIWRATSKDSICKDDDIQVQTVEGLLLHVTKIGDDRDE